MIIDLHELTRPCPCGHQHPLTVKDIRIGQGVLSALPSILASYGWSAPVLICDDHTWLAAGRAIESLLPQAILACVPSAGLHADEAGVAAVRLRLPDVSRYDCLLAVGSGTVHDLTRYLAHDLAVPFVSIPTAASVDGYVSTVAAMTWQGCKQTLPAVAPLAVIADSDIFSQAPRRLTASGFGDLLGKYIALADWQIASAVTGEYYCPTVAALMQSAVDAVVQQADEIAAGGTAGCEKLMAGLLLSGLAMQMVGNSRPASGAEHHISHLWEMAVLNKPLDALHGEKVGIGLLLCADLYHAFADALRADPLRADAVLTDALRADPMRTDTSWVDPLRDSELPANTVRSDARTEILANFTEPGMVGLLLAENNPDPLTGLAASDVRSKQEAILAVIDALPSAFTLQQLLRKTGGRTTLASIGLTPAIIPGTLQLAPYVRSRLTLLRLLKLFKSESILSRCDWPVA